MKRLPMVGSLDQGKSMDPIVLKALVVFAAGLPVPRVLTGAPPLGSLVTAASRRAA